MLNNKNMMEICCIAEIYVHTLLLQHALYDSLRTSMARQGRERKKLECRAAPKSVSFSARIHISFIASPCVETGPSGAHIRK